MADACCNTEAAACCEPPALVLPGESPKAAAAASCKLQAASCKLLRGRAILLPKGIPVFDGVNPSYKRILWTVIGINGAMFLGEMVAGQLAGSQALTKTATLTCALSGYAHATTPSGTCS